MRHRRAALRWGWAHSSSWSRLFREWEQRVRQARTEVARGIDGVARSAAERKADAPHQAGHKPLAHAAAGPVAETPCEKMAPATMTSTMVPMTSLITLKTGLWTAPWYRRRRVWLRDRE